MIEGLRALVIESLLLKLNNMEIIIVLGIWLIAVYFILRLPNNERKGKGVS